MIARLITLYSTKACNYYATNNSKFGGITSNLKHHLSYSSPHSINNAMLSSSSFYNLHSWTLIKSQSRCNIISTFARAQGIITSPGLRYWFIAGGGTTRTLTGAISGGEGRGSSNSNLKTSQKKLNRALLDAIKWEEVLRIIKEAPRELIDSRNFSTALFKIKELSVKCNNKPISVSYTHLTLPTSDLV